MDNKQVTDILFSSFERKSFLLLVFEFKENTGSLDIYYQRIIVILYYMLHCKLEIDRKTVVHG